MNNNKHILVLLIAGCIAACKANPNISAEMIENAMNFKMDKVLARHQKEHNVSSNVISNHERELKRYLLLAAAFPEKNFGMYSKEIDELWHTFLLFSRDYHAFCLQAAGRYIHHEPTDAPGNNDQEACNKFLEFAERYKEMYGHELPDETWGIHKKKFCIGSISCNTCDAR